MPQKITVQDGDFEVISTTGDIRLTTVSGNIVIDGSSATSLSHAGTSVATTTTAASGGLTVNNTATGGGFERVLTISDLTGGTPVDITVANEATDATSFISFFTAATGDLGPKTNAALTFDASTADLSSTLIAGIASGDLLDKTAVETVSGVWTYSDTLITDASDTTASGFRLPHGAAPTSPVDGDMWTTAASVFVRVSGVSEDLLSAGGTPTLITVANETTDPTSFPLFAISATGDLGPKTNAGFTFNASTADLSSTLIAGIANTDLVDKSAVETISGVWTYSDTLITDATDATASGLRIPHGTAPSAPVDGDIWTTAASVFVRISGSTQDLLAGGTPTIITVVNEASDTTSFPAFFTAATGDLGPKTNAGFTFDAATADLNSTLIAGIANANLVDKSAVETVSGVWTHSDILITDASDTTAAGFRLPHGAAPTSPTDGDMWTTASSVFVRVSGVSEDLLSAGGTPTLITVANEAVDTTSFPLFAISATGDLGPKTNAGLTFNASTADLNSTLIAGIANANLLDKSATETISGAWTFSNQIDIHRSDGLAKDFLHLSDTTDVADLVFHYNGANFEIRNEAAGASDVYIRFIDDTAQERPQFFFNNVLKAAPSLQSFKVFADIVTASPPTTELPHAKIEFRDLDDTDTLGFVGFAGQSNIQFKNLMRGGQLHLLATDTGGIQRTILNADPDAKTILNADTDLDLTVAISELALRAIANGAVTLYHNNIAKLATASDGIDVTGDVGGTTIGGITEANLVDKTAAETITAKWIHEIDSIATNVAIPALQVSATSTGTPLAGIGPSIEFKSETTAGAPGNQEIGATIVAETTDVGVGTEDFDFVFNTMATGATAAERMRISSTGIVTATSFSGSLTGNADTATTATGATNIDINATTSTDTTTFLVLVGADAAGNQLPFIDNIDLSYNASTGNLSATQFGGIVEADLLDKSANETIGGSWSFNTLVGGKIAEAVRADDADSADRINVATGGSIDTTMFPVLVGDVAGIGGQLPVIEQGDLKFNASTGDLVPLRLGGILTGNLVDKSASETISGNWTFDITSNVDFDAIVDFNNQPGFRVNSADKTKLFEIVVNNTGLVLFQTQAGGQIRLNTPDIIFSDSVKLLFGTDSDIDFNYDTIDFNSTFTNTADWNISGLTGRIAAGTIDVDFNAITATSYGGITEANLLDKTAVETISGVYSHTAALLTTASVAGAAGLRIPHGTAPTTPVNGDMWTTTTSAFIRINGATQDLLSVGTPTSITVANEATDTTSFPAFFTAATGDLGPKTNAGFTFNASTADLNSTLIAGIANTNLLDKSATETISGGWTFSGTLTIPQASVTSHEEALTILESQITDGSIFPRIASTESITGTWTLDGSVTGSDFGTGGKVKDGTDVARPIGFNVMPVYEIDVNDTFDLAHNGMLWHKDAGGVVTFTCDNDATIPQGATYGVHNDDAEDLTIAEGTGVTILFLAPGAAPVSGNVVLKQGSIATVYKYTDIEFWVWGAVSDPLSAGIGISFSGSNAIDLDISALTNIDIGVFNPADSILVNDAGTMKQMDSQDMGVRVVNSSAIQTFALADVNTLQILTGATDRIWTIPANATTAIHIGAIIYLGARDTAKITILAASGVTLTSVHGSGAAGSDIVDVGGMAALIKVATDEWMLSGDIST